MKFLYAKLTGYIGLYNGLGLSSIELDFTKCKNKIVVIGGPNGVGKSTLLKALSIIPDSNDNFVPSMEASKQLKIFDDGTIYDILITHPLNSNNKRGITKASICKNREELNPNGNISSYKEIIFSEFELDSNYISLSRISGENRGIVDKKPAERIKFVSSILDSLETYNSIHKILNKKANIFKSYVNNLSGKIQGIGDEKYIRTTLTSLSNQITRYQSQIDHLKSEISKLEAILSLDNIDQNTQMEYDKYQKEYEQSLQEMNRCIEKEKEFIEILAKEGIDVFDIEINELILDKRSIITQNESSIRECVSKSQSITQKQTVLREEINSLKIKFEKMNSNIDTSLSSKIDEYKKDVQDIIDLFSSLKIYDMDNITPEEIRHVITIINDIISRIDIFYESIDSIILNELILINFDKNNINTLIEENKNNIQSLQFKKEDLEKYKVELLEDKKIISSLDNRPKKCNIDTCYFVSEAIKLLNKKYTDRKRFNNEIKKTDDEIYRLENKITILKKEAEKYESMFSSCVLLGEIMHTINLNLDLFNKIGISQQILNKSSFLDLISQESKFNFLRDLNKYYDLSNNLIIYKQKKDILVKLSAEYEIQKNNLSIMKEYNESISFKELELEDYDKQLKLCTSIINRSNEINQATVKIINKLNYSSTLKEKSKQAITITKEKAIKYQELSDRLQSSSNILGNINRMKQQIDSIMTDLVPLENQKKNLEAQLILLDSYQQEYSIYKEKYEIINKLQKYSSPREGIQELFMNIYMSKTLDLGNQLLSMIFGGQYKLLNYIISDGEFRMPFIGNGLIVDDISSGSTSQVCIMGMIINLVMRNQASNKYNITSLDEIDGGLDHQNRYLFVDILEKIISILNIEQLFIISHSVESVLNNVDVIQLSNSQDYNDLFNNSNVIYKYV